MSIGSRLKELRGDQSQRAVALAVGIKQQVWNRYEKDETAPASDSILKICDTFKVSSDWLLGIDHGASAADKPIKTSSQEKDCEACPFKQLALAFQASAAKLPRK